MRVLLLTQWYLPEPQKVVSDIAESLQEMGHEVTVLTGFPNYPSGKLYPGYRIKLWQKEKINGVSVIRFPLYPDHSPSAAKRAWNFVSFAISTALLTPLLAPSADIIHVIHPPITIGFPAWVLSRLRRIPFVYEIHDLWPETLAATGMMNNARILSAVGWLARRVYHSATMMRVVSPGCRENLIRKGIPENKISVIFDGVDDEYYTPVEPSSALADELGLSQGFIVMYAGTIGLAQGLETVVEAAQLLRDISHIHFVFVGEGLALKGLQQRVAERNLSNVKFLGRFPASEMPGINALADIQIVHLRDDPLFRITIPHKIFSCMASANPILAAVTGDAADIVRSAEAGLTCPPSNPQAMADTILRFYQMSSEELESMGRNGRAAACGPYSRKHLTRELSNILEEVVKCRRKKSGAVQIISTPKRSA